MLPLAALLPLLHQGLAERERVGSVCGAEYSAKCPQEWSYTPARGGTCAKPQNSSSHCHAPFAVDKWDAAKKQRWEGSEVPCTCHIIRSLCFAGISDGLNVANRSLWRAAWLAHGALPARVEI